MNEIKIFFDASKSREATGAISFESVRAGESTRKSLWLSNEIKFSLELDLSIVGESVVIEKTVKSIGPGELKEVVFLFSPKLTIVKPVEASLNVGLSYVVV